MTSSLSSAEVIPQWWLSGCDADDMNSANTEGGEDD